MQECTTVTYVDDYLGCSFSSKEECEGFEAFCDKLKIFSISYGTDFAEGHYELQQRGRYVVCYCKDIANYEPIVKYYLYKYKGTEFDVVAGKYRSTGVYRGWSIGKAFNGDALKRPHVKEVVAKGLDAIITDTDIILPDFNPSLKSFQSTMLTIYRSESE